MFNAADESKCAARSGGAKVLITQCPHFVCACLVIKCPSVASDSVPKSRRVRSRSGRHPLNSSHGPKADFLSREGNQAGQSARQFGSPASKGVATLAPGGPAGDLCIPAQGRDYWLVVPQGVPMIGL